MFDRPNFIKLSFHSLIFIGGSMAQNLTNQKFLVVHPHF